MYGKNQSLCTDVQKCGGLDMYLCGGDGTRAKRIERAPLGQDHSPLLAVRSVYTYDAFASKKSFRNHFMTDIYL